MLKNLKQNPKKIKNQIIESPMGENIRPVEKESIKEDVIVREDVPSGKDLLTEIKSDEDFSKLVQPAAPQDYVGNYDFKTLKTNINYKKLRDGENQSLLKAAFLGKDGLLKLNYFTHTVNDGSGDQEWKSGKHRTILIYLTVINEEARKIVNRGMVLKNFFHDDKNCDCLKLVKSAIILFPHSYRMMSNCPFVIDHYKITRN